MNNRNPKIIVTILAAGIMGIMLTALLKKEQHEDALVKLNAAVTFDGSRITVSNNDTLDYLNAELTVNSYYTISDINLRAGETYTFWPVEFAHLNGQRLPSKQQPQQFALWCSLHNGGNGFFSVKFQTE